MTDRENPDIGIGIKGVLSATPSFVRRRAARYAAIVVNCIWTQWIDIRNYRRDAKFRFIDRQRDVRSLVIDKFILSK